VNIYLAHPFSGQSAEEVFGYYDSLKKELSDYYSIFCPMTGKDYMRNEIKFRGEGYFKPTATNHAIKNRDQWMVRESDVVFLDFTGAKSISIGCCMELAWANILGKHTVVVVDEIHKHAFVLESADIIFETSEEAIQYLKLLSKEE
jgi:nucleoside 2-deoxyribosyltransferase